MKFDLKKAQAGEAVQVSKVLTLDDAFATIREHSWDDLNAHFIGEDVGGNIIYQINKKSGDNIIYTCIQSVNPKFLRMKSKYKTWWFRTCMYNSGQPGVIVRDSKAELLDLDLPDGMYWVEEPWSAEFSENNNEYTY